MKKKDNDILNTYNRYYGRTLYDCYNKPSTEKATSWFNIHNEMIANKGYGLTVLSYNTFMYTCAYTYTDESTNTELLVVHTPTTKREFEIEYM